MTECIKKWSTANIKWEIDMTTIITQYLPYVLIGLGIGYLVTTGVTGGATELDYRKQDVEAQKARFKMLADRPRSGNRII